MNRLAVPALLLCVACGGGDLTGPLPGHAPRGLTAKQLSFTTIRLSWNTVPGALYLLQRAAAPGAWSQIGGHLLTNPQFVDFDVAAGAAYGYRVAAVTLTDTSAFSAPMTFSTAVSCPGPAAKSVLVDASHDGGAWWYPQMAPFNPDDSHQGRLLADTLRAMGYAVTEVPRGDIITQQQLLSHAIVIRAGKYGAYEQSELFAYDDFVDCPRTLLLLAEYLRPGEHDELAERLGIPLDTIVTGTVTTFASHAITTGVSTIPFIAGSVLRGDIPPSVTVLGWLDTGEAAMGVLTGEPAKVFWIGDTNAIEFVPQPLVNNLVAWGF